MDSAKLMKETCLGCKYDIESIGIAKSYAKGSKIGVILDCYEKEHEKIKNDVSAKIKERGFKEYKHPKLGAAMTKLHTNLSLTLNPSYSNLAELMINGCNMGIKNLSKQKDKAKGIDRDSVSSLDAVIECEMRMINDMLPFLK
jgi:hypothetical protein